MKFEEKHFKELIFTKEQIQKNFDNALHDMDISKKDEILDVKFNYAYTALLKAGISLLSFYNQKVKSAPGHHVKTIEKLALILEDEDVESMGNLMRSKRNVGLYDGGIEITQKECTEYIDFVERVLDRVNKIISRK